MEVWECKQVTDFDQWTTTMKEERILGSVKLHIAELWGKL